MQARDDPLQARKRRPELRVHARKGPQYFCCVAGSQPVVDEGSFLKHNLPQAGAVLREACDGVGFVLVQVVPGPVIVAQQDGGGVLERRAPDGVGVCAADGLEGDVGDPRRSVHLHEVLPIEEADRLRVEALAGTQERNGKTAWLFPRNVKACLSL